MLPITYITGWAGTGKSTYLANLLNHPKYLDKNILILTPTHKAKQVMESKFKYRKYTTFKTIHSLLRAIPSINEQAKKKAHLNKLLKSAIKELRGQKSLFQLLKTQHYICFDEAGMIDADLFNTALELFEALELQARIIVLLDPYQLTPVRAKQISIPPITSNRPPKIEEVLEYNKPKPQRFNLTAQYRSAQHITSYYTKVIAHIQRIMGEEPILDLSKKENNIIRPDKFITLQEAVNNFNPKTDQFLAYTNKTVAEFNQKVKERLNLKLFSSGLPLTLGNTTIIAMEKKLYKELPLTSLPLYNQRGIIQAEFASHSKKIVKDSKSLFWFKALVDSPSWGEVRGYFMVMPSYYSWFTLCKKLDNYLVTKNREKSWKDINTKRAFLSQKYYPVKNAFPLDFAFASTVHKAQGQEFKNVYIHYEDLKLLYQTNKEQFLRLLYVATSRAMENLYFIR